jgi:hypothetical protein
MALLTGAVGRHILNGIGAAVGRAALSGSRTAAGGLMSRIAAAGILRLALRSPALSVFLIVSALAARLLARRAGPPDGRSPILRSGR